MIQTVGKVQTELDAKKGIWCEFCKTRGHKMHLITLKQMQSDFAPLRGNPVWESITLMCSVCAQDVIKCIQRSLVDALLTDKEDL